MGKSVWAGLAAGVLHTLTGPDHLAALTPLTIGRTVMHSSWLGCLWGCGHNTGQLFFGALFILLRSHINFDTDFLSQWSQILIGTTLLLISFIGFKEAKEIKEEDMVAAPDKKIMASTSDNKFALGTFATGIVHGFQPDALLVLLPAIA